jgi:hypothetical protein
MAIQFRAFLTVLRESVGIGQEWTPILESRFADHYALPRRAIVASAAGFAFACTLAACGGGGTSASNSTTSASVAPEAWANSVCTSVRSWENQLTTQAQTLSAQVNGARTLTQAKSAALSFFDSAINSTTTMVGAVKSAGTPGLPNGGAIEQVMVAGTQQILTTLNHGKRSAQQLPVNDVTAFQTQAAAIGGTLQGASTQARSAFQQAGSKYPQLVQVLRTQQSCQGLIAG